MTYYMYVSISGESKISIYTMNPETGLLAFKEDVALSSGPGPLAADPGGQFLYAGHRSTCEIQSFRIDRSTGGLAQIGSVEIEADPAYLATDRQGRFVLSAHYSAGMVGVHPIDADGAAGGPPIEWISTAPRAHCVLMDPSNRFVFIPHVVPGNVIFQFAFDENTGALTPNAVPRVEGGENQGPRHLCFHPHKDMVYSSDEQGSTVTAYHFDSSAGTLAAFQTISTLPPEGYDGEENAPAQIQITPSGKFLYAPNRGHESVACFRVDEETGKLSTIGYQPIEEHTRGISLDPQGRFLYTTGAASGRLASFRISEQTGALEPLENFAVGEGPMWVLFVRQED